MAAGTHRIIGTAQVAQVVQRRYQPGPGQSELVLSNHQRHLRVKANRPIPIATIKAIKPLKAIFSAIAVSNLLKKVAASMPQYYTHKN